MLPAMPHPEGRDGQAVALDPDLARSSLTRAAPARSTRVGRLALRPRAVE
jgi:hypothetical protein